MSFPENTSTSPSGFHLMHSKTHIMAHDLNKKDLEYAVIKQKCQQLIQWQLDLLNLTLKHSYSFKRWKTIANIMLLKEPGNIKIHRLCMINLNEHDYNLLLAIKW